MAEKIRIGLPESAFPFMPPPDKLVAYLGMPGGIAGIVNKLSDQPGQLRRIDPKTVRKAVREGVSPRSFEQIKGIIESVVTPEIYEYINSPDLAPWAETTLPQNGLSWLCLTEGFHIRAFQGQRRQTQTECFIKRRAEQEMELLQTCRKIRKNSPSPEIFHNRGCEYVIDFLKQHTEIDPTLITSALQAWPLLESKTIQPNNESIGLLLSLYTRLRIDFYYQLLCNVSLDLIQWFKEHDGIGEHGQWLIENSLFGDMVPKLEADKLILPFEKLMDAWRRNAAPDGSDLSWADIARCIPNPQGVEPGKQSLAPGQTRDDRVAAIEKNKKSRLREWRQGTRPKRDQLEQFIQNLVPNGNDASSAILRADISCVWGKFILDELAVFEKLGLENTYRETLAAFELYPCYWANYKAQAAQIIAA